LLPDLPQPVIVDSLGSQQDEELASTSSALGAGEITPPPGDFTAGDTARVYHKGLSEAMTSVAPGSQHSPEAMASDQDRSADEVADIEDPAQATGADALFAPRNADRSPQAWFARLINMAAPSAPPQASQERRAPHNPSFTPPRQASVQHYLAP